ncbi:SHOCT domain-containing protein [Halorussus lipolyticus]|uniref:SHOCT domain-containing protein n=1 Tax=Halorussus lipolyticus TaxID=3034024 RepID=UPI0023E803A3|nr:SHOCT domain-containing protein [Halorussus sp. DT80]
MSTPGEDTRRLASMLADRADHESVTTARLAGTDDAVADLESAVVTHLVPGERPMFCFECHDSGVGLGEPEATVEPERGGIYCVTDRRVYVQLGLPDDDESLSVRHCEVSGVRYREGRRHHRLDLAASDTMYFLWVSANADPAAVARAAEYVTSQSDAESPETDTEDERSSGESSLSDRLERLGDAKSRGLIDDDEFQRRKDRLLDE